MVNPVVRLQKELEEILLAGGIENAAMEARWIAEDITDAEQARSIARKRAEHYPLQYLLGRTDSLLCALAPLLAPLFALPSYALWRLGVSKYQSAGS